VIDPAEVKERVRRARGRRAPLLEAGIEGLRLFDGEGDGIPRLTIEQFGAAVRISGGPEHAGLLAPLREVLGSPRELFWRLGHEHRGGPPGDDGRRVVREHGLRFEVRLVPDRHVGLFLEARDLRAWVREHSAGRRVLNLFAYTCAFGVAAAAGGARATTNVDAVPSALARGRVNYELNGLSLDGRTFWKSDVLAALEAVKAQGGGFDGVVLHPPPVKTGGGRGRRIEPVRDLQRLVDACKAVLAPGGWLLLAWTSSALTDAALVDAAGLGVPLWAGTSGPDFVPTPGRPGLRAFAFGR
jgi:23S rRNA (cytosine1962-C5)-methyltransferase